MVDRRANIDLLFRNGLKDYEVLPPQDIWENIQPSIRKRPGMIFLRYAAAVAIISCLGFITLMLTRDITQEVPGAMGIFSIDRSDPIRLAEALPAPVVKIVPSQKRPPAIVPEKAEFTSDINVLNYSINRNPVISGPERAEVQSAPGNINIENVGKDLPDHFPDIKLPDKRWSISAMASPTYYSKRGSGNEEFLKMTATENAAPSYSGGIGLSYRISKRFTIQTGLYYSGYGQEIGSVNSYSGFNRYTNAKGHGNFEVVTSNGHISTNNGDVFLMADAQTGKVLTSYNNDVFDPKKANLDYVNSSIIQNFSYIQMPVHLRYKLIDRNIDLNLLGGVSYDFLVGNSVFAKTGSGRYSVGDTKGLNSLIFSSSVGMGVEYNFSEKVSLNFEPTLRYFLNPFNNAAGTRVHPYSFGVFSGISYKF